MTFHETEQMAALSGNCKHLAEQNASLQHQLTEARKELTEAQEREVRLLAACKAKEELAILAQRIGYPSRGSFDEAATIQFFADEIQKHFLLEQLEYLAFNPSSTALSDYLREETKGLVDALRDLSHICTCRRSDKLIATPHGMGVTTPGDHESHCVHVIARAALARFQAAPTEGKAE